MGPRERVPRRRARVGHGDPARAGDRPTRHRRRSVRDPLRRARDRRTAAIAALLVPLALTAHHTGIVALAPVLAVVAARRSLGTRPAGRVRDARDGRCLVVCRPRRSSARTLATGSRTRGRRPSSASRRRGATSSSRYVLVDGFPWATPLRRASVALIGLTLLAFVTRRRDRTSAARPSGDDARRRPRPFRGHAEQDRRGTLARSPGCSRWRSARRWHDSATRVRERGAGSYARISSWCGDRGGRLVVVAPRCLEPRRSAKPHVGSGARRHASVLEARDRAAGDRPRMRDAGGPQTRSSLRGHRDPVACRSLDGADARRPVDRLHDRRARS